MTEEPAFDYARQKRNRLEDYILRERDYYFKIVRKYGRSDQRDAKKE
jgi:fructose 1,6-bisphosphatase